MELAAVAAAAESRLEDIRYAVSPFVQSVARVPDTGAFTTVVDLKLDEQDTYSDLHGRRLTVGLKQAWSSLARAFSHGPEIVPAPIGAAFRPYAFHSFWERLEGRSTGADFRTAEHAIPVEGARLIGALEAVDGSGWEEILERWVEPAEPPRFQVKSSDTAVRFGSFCAEAVMGLRDPMGIAMPRFTFRPGSAKSNEYLKALAGAASELGGDIEGDVFGSVTLGSILSAAKLFGAIEAANDLNIMAAMESFADQMSGRGHADRMAKFAVLGAEFAKGSTGQSRSNALNELAYPGRQTYLPVPA